MRSNYYEKFHYSPQYIRCCRVLPWGHGQPEDYEDLCKEKEKNLCKYKKKISQKNLRCAILQKNHYAYST